MCLISSSDIMFECVSLIIWPTIAKYSLILLWFYVLYQKLQKYCNDISVLKRAYLYNHWFKSYELKSIRKPRRGTLLYLYNAKCDSYAVKCYIISNPKLPNIAMLLEPTVWTLTSQSSNRCSIIWYTKSHQVLISCSNFKSGNLMTLLLWDLN